jgi:hypothetical protein
MAHSRQLPTTTNTQLPTTMEAQLFVVVETCEGQTETERERLPLRVEVWQVGGEGTNDCEWQGGKTHKLSGCCCFAPKKIGGNSLLCANAMTVAELLRFLCCYLLLHRHRPPLLARYYVVAPLLFLLACLLLVVPRSVLLLGLLVVVAVALHSAPHLRTSSNHNERTASRAYYSQGTRCSARTHQAV